MPDIWQLLLEGAEAGAAHTADSTADGGKLAPLLHAGGRSSSSVPVSLPQLHRSLSGASSAGCAADGSCPSAATAHQRLRLLWQPLLDLLQQYISFPAESTAVLGVNQLRHLLLAVAPALDVRAWQSAIVMLQAILQADPWAVLTSCAAGMPTSSPSSGGSSSRTGSPWAVAAAAEGLRRCSRRAVLLQRVLDSVLQQRAADMPGQVQLQLLELLHCTVLAAATLNSDLVRRSAAEQALLASVAAVEQGHLAFQASVPVRQLTGGGEIWGMAVSAAAVAGAAGEVPAASLVAAQAVADVDELARGSSGGSGWENTLPALIRQEAEGGCLYIAALQRCVATPISSNGTEAAVAAECEARLSNFCLWVVAGAAERAVDLGSSESGLVDPTPAAALEAAADAIAGPGNGSGSFTVGVTNPADQPWEDAVRWVLSGRASMPSCRSGLAAVEPLWFNAWHTRSPCFTPHFLVLLCRAPLVDAALQAYAGLSPAAWARQQTAAFPHLARLVCSPSKGVRRALRVLLQQQVPSAIAAMQASAGGAGRGA